MGTVFKKTFTKPLPAGADLFTREGQQYAKWKDAKGKTRKAIVTASKQGEPRILVQSRTYFAKYRDGGRTVRVVSTECRDEQAARSVLADLERRAELVKAGVMTASEDATAMHQGTPLQAHLDAYAEHMRARGLSPTHRAYTKKHLQRIKGECGFAALKDFDREAFERWLVGLADAGAGARTRNCYRDDLVTFCNWCIATNRLLSNPFEMIPKANVECDRKRIRRAMTETELVKLLDVARGRPLLDAMTVRRGKRKGQAYAKLRDETKGELERLGRERALIYKTLILTGLRKNELASLTVGQAHLDGDIPYVALNAADEKNRQGCEIVLRDDLAGDLREWLADQLVRLQGEAKERGEPIPARLPAELPLFRIPTGLLRILDRDLKAAGIDKADERGRTLDVHALRTTFGTLLSKGGVAPRTAQAAMRHSDIRLTMQTYTDPKLLDVRGALDALPALPLGTGPEHATGLKTGTDDSPLAPTLAPTWCKRSTPESNADKTNTDGQPTQVSETTVASPDSVKRNDPLTIAVSGSGEWSLRGSNPRPHGCDPCALAN